MGDALVRNEQGQAYFRAININNEDHEIVVPTLTLKNFTMYENQEDSQSSVLKSRSLNVVASVKVISVTGSNHGNNRRMSQQNEINNSFGRTPKRRNVCLFRRYSFMRKVTPGTRDKI